MPDAVNCPTPQELTAFGLGKLPQQTAAAVAAHLQSCAKCLKVVADVTPDSFLDKVRAAGPTGSCFSLSLAQTDNVPNSAGKPATLVAPCPDLRRELAQHPRYLILRELGRGGMGVVYKARHLQLDRIVALKTILSGGHASATELARFKDEAKAIARLQHPNIVQIYDVSEQDGLHYFALEYCAGGSLDKKLAGTPLPPKDAAALVGTLARAMHAAHEKGIVHRDLKPANVLLAADGTAKVTDFGLAKLLDETSRTTTGAVMGTPSYMAPEQAEGNKRQIGPPTDVYSLGAILYECLTGRPPFHAATTIDTLRQVLTEEPVPPSWLHANISPDLDAICLKCLAKEPVERYASAEDLAEDLRRFLGGEPLTALPFDQNEWTARWARRVGYEIIEEIGRGYMSIVYKAKQKSLNRLVTLKILYQPRPTAQMGSLNVAVDVSLKRLNKQLMLKDVVLYRLRCKGEEAQLEYFVDEDLLRLPIPRVLLSQPEELARHLEDRPFTPAAFAGEIAQEIIRSLAEELRRNAETQAKTQETMANRFRVEAELLSQLQHPNIVPIYDFGEVGDLRYFSVEWTEGGALSHDADTVPQLSRSPRQAAQLVEILARAVHYAHQRGIVHRDLRPSNVFLTRDGLPKIADFGLAKNRHSLEKIDTPGVVLSRGAPIYIAPEQACGNVEDIGPRSDVYGLGAIFYELLTGSPPFRGESELKTLAQVMKQVMTEKPKRPRVLNPNLDSDLEAICLKCLDKEPGNRYSSAEELAEDLRRFLVRSFWMHVWKWIRRRFQEL